MNNIDPLQQITHLTDEVNDRVREVLAAAAAVDGSSAFSDQVMLAVAQGSRALFGLADPSGSGTEYVGFAVWGAGEADLVVHPDSRGSGVGSRALRALVTIASESGVAQMKSWSHGAHPAPAALLRGAGFVGARTLYKMVLDPARLEAAVAEARPMPPGIRVVRYDPDAATHADEWVRINAAAFANHPEQGAVTKSDFIALTQEPWFSADDLCFALRGSDTEPEFLGFSWVKTVKDPPSDADDSRSIETELYVLGVHPDAAGTGVGAALFGVSLQCMRAHHPDAVSLYVDANNTRAVKLYERAGFTVATQSTQWVRSLPVR